MRTALRQLGIVILFGAVGLCFAPTIVPPFLDRIYYEGPVSGHFDGRHFFNPDLDATVAPRAPLPGRGGLVGRFLAGDDRPPWPAAVAVTSTRPAARVAGEAMVATWIGHASFLIQTAGINILTDPIWSDRAGPFGIGPRRVAAPGIAFADLPRIDLVLISHNHYDHLDLETLRRLWSRDRPLIVTSLGNDTILRAAGIEAIALDWGGQ
ncbi:MAG: MBL fold metallo-hydrolase, partial [Sphingomonas sp.]